MSNVVPFKPQSKSKQKAKKKQSQNQKTMCKNGFHKWKVDTEKKFDVKAGKLVTVYRCEYCNEVKHKLT